MKKTISKVKVFTNKTNLLIVILLVLVLICVGVLLYTKFTSVLNTSLEGFEDLPEGAQDLLNQFGELDEETRKATLMSMRDKLVDYGLLPDMDEAEVDRTKWIPKSAIPPSSPPVDLSQYVKKSSIPPPQVCPPQKEVDLTQYVKRSTLPPTQKCPPCIAPKVKVSAGLCKTCPPCPTCPPPKRCPEMKCPEPEPCPKVECPKCSEIKYIKVPTIITKTVRVDANNNVVSEEVKETKPTKPVVKNVKKQEENNNNNQANEIEMKLSDEERANNRKVANTSTCSAYNLNSAYKQTGIYGYQ
jgi:hypothetical protein